MNVIYEKSFHFAIRVVKLYRFMTDSKQDTGFGYFTQPIT